VQTSSSTAVTRETKLTLSIALNPKIKLTLESGTNPINRNTTLCLKEVPTFTLSITLSNLNQFSKFLHCWKVYEICYKTYMTLLKSP